MNLIDADKLITAIKKEAVVIDINAIKRVVVRDVEYVPVIRCKDCKWHQGKDCMAWDDGTVAVANEVEDDGYCYLAERKEE